MNFHKLTTELSFDDPGSLWPVVALLMRTANFVVAGFLRLNANGFVMPSPFLSVLSYSFSLPSLLTDLRHRSRLFSHKASLTPLLFPFLSLSLVLAFHLLVAASVSLPTELRLRSRLPSTEYIWLR
jgi:hypothetical protein